MINWLARVRLPCETSSLLDAAFSDESHDRRGVLPMKGQSRLCAIMVVYASVLRRSADARKVWNANLRDGKASERIDFGDAALH